MNDEIKNNVRKSGTSIVGIVCKDGVVIGADRRSTAGNMIMSKNSKKAIPIQDRIVVAGTGVASDIDLSQRVFSAELKLLELKTRSKPTVKESASLFGMMSYRNIRTPSMVPSIVGMLVGGFNEDGTTELYTIEPAGGVYPVEDYDANFSSGMPFILGLLERQWKPDLTIKEGVELAQEALKSSTQRDSASGNGIDVFSITKDGIKHEISQTITPQFN